MTDSLAPGAVPSHVNPFLEADLAAHYDRWHSDPGRRADLREQRLLRRVLLRLGNVRTIPDVGCITDISPAGIGN